MSFAVRTLDVPTTGSTVSLSGLSFEPSAVIVMSSGGGAALGAARQDFSFSMGADDGTRNVCLSSMEPDNLTTTDPHHTLRNDCCAMGIEPGVAAVDWRVSVDSYDSTGITFSIDDSPSSAVKLVLFLTDENLECGTFQADGTTGVETYSLNDSGLTPQGLITLFAGSSNSTVALNAFRTGVWMNVGVADGTNQGQAYCFSRANRTTSITYSMASDDMMLRYGYYSEQTVFRYSIDGFDAGEFSLDWIYTSSTATNHAYIAFDFPCEVMSYTQPTSNGASSSSAFGFNPQAVMALVSAGTDGGYVDHARIGAGFVESGASPDQYCVFSADRDNVTTTACAAVTEDEFIHMEGHTGSAFSDYGNATAEIDGDTVDFTWSEVDGTARIINLMAFGSTGGGAVTGDISGDALGGDSLAPIVTARPGRADVATADDASAAYAVMQTAVVGGATANGQIAEATRVAAGLSANGEAYDEYGASSATVGQLAAGAVAQDVTDAISNAVSGVIASALAASTAAATQQAAVGMIAAAQAAAGQQAGGAVPVGMTDASTAGESAEPSQQGAAQVEAAAVAAIEQTAQTHNARDVIAAAIADSSATPGQIAAAQLEAAVGASDALSAAMHAAGNLLAGGTADDLSAATYALIADMSSSTTAGHTYASALGLVRLTVEDASAAGIAAAAAAHTQAALAAGALADDSYTVIVGGVEDYLIAGAIALRAAVTATVRVRPDLLANVRIKPQ